MIDVKLIQGDCNVELDKLPSQSVNLILTDIPYGIDFQSNQRPKEERFDKIQNDKEVFTECIPKLKRLLKPDGGAMLFTRWDVQQAYIDKLEECDLPVKSVIIWDKKRGGYGRPSTTVP